MQCYWKSKRVYFIPYLCCSLINKLKMNNIFFLVWLFHRFKCQYSYVKNNLVKIAAKRLRKIPRSICYWSLFQTEIALINHNTYNCVYVFSLKMYSKTHWYYHEGRLDSCIIQIYWNDLLSVERNLLIYQREILSHFMINNIEPPESFTVEDQEITHPNYNNMTVSRNYA